MRRWLLNRLVQNSIKSDGELNNEVLVSLELLSNGWELGQIAEQLGYSRTGLEQKLYMFRYKHGWKNRTQMVSEAIRNGWIK